MVFVDLVGRAGHVELLRPTPELLILLEVPDLAIEFVLARVTLDEVVGRPPQHLLHVLPLPWEPRTLNIV